MERDLRQQAVEELKRAVDAHGGEYIFYLPDDEMGDMSDEELEKNDEKKEEAPVVLCNGDYGAFDATIAFMSNADGLRIYGNKDGDVTYSIDIEIDSLSASSIQYIIEHMEEPEREVTVDSALRLLHEAVNGSEEEFYREAELQAFAKANLYNWDKDTDGNQIAEEFVKWMWNSDNACRRCSECGRLMKEGYMVGDEPEYYCSDECLHQHYTDEEYVDMYDHGRSQTCYTNWY